MVRVITQETFDLVVTENMEEFEMDRAEAVKDAKEQFEQQGVSLVNIVVSEQGSQVVVEAVKALFGEEKEENLLASLTTIMNCCDGDLAQRVLATDNGAYSALLRHLGKPGVDLQCKVLETLSKVMDTNPDHLEAQGVEHMYNLLSSPQDSILVAVLDWMLICCVRHEGNRVALVDRPGLLGRTAQLASEKENEVVMMVCKLWVQLVQDDDVRVPFGKAHDHARELVEVHHALTVLTKVLVTQKENKDIAGPCLLGLASLCLRNEYCQEVVDEGGLKAILDILEEDNKQAEVITRALVLLKVLAGNDQVKTEVGRSGGLHLITAAITQFLPRASTAEAGCAALAAVCLRQSENCVQAVTDCEGAAVVTSCMRQHPKQKKVQAAAAAAIRNIVSRDKQLCPPFIEKGVEELLNSALDLHGDHIGDTLRSALRDLELKVELQERWTGEKIKITESFVATEGVHD